MGNKVIVGGIYNFGINLDSTILIVVVYKTEDYIILTALNDVYVSNINSEINSKINEILEIEHDGPFGISILDFYKFTNFQVINSTYGYLGNVSDDILLKLQQKAKNQYPNYFK